MMTLSQRTMSAFPLSIGTSLAFESIFTGRQPPYDSERTFDKIDITVYNELWVNVLTLIRNVLGSIDSDTYSIVNENQVYQTVVEEFEIIDSLMNNEGQGLIKAVFYIPSYDRIYNHSNKNVILRLAHTPKQIREKYIETKVIEKLKKSHVKEISLTDDQLKGSYNSKSLIITHYPYDLLSYKNFNTLHLLESHTGVLKKRDQWASKYHNGKDIMHMPFQDKLLKILGDNIMFKPMLSAYRKLIIDVSINKKWTPLTSEEKVRFDLDLEIKDKFLIYEVYDKI